MKFDIANYIQNIKTHYRHTLTTLKSLYSHVVSNRSTYLIGIDLGAEGIKVIGIEKDNDQLIVKSFCTSPTPTGTITKEGIKNPPLLSATIKELVNQIDARAKMAAIAIPRSLAIIKQLSISEALNDDEVQSRVMLEANRLFPELIDEIYLDYTIIGKSERDQSQLEIIIAACKKEQINPYIDTLKGAGLIPKIIDINCYALDRALAAIKKQDEKREAIALLNLNYDFSTLIISENNKLIHTHDESFDGKHLMSQVNEYLSDTHTNIDKKSLRNDIVYQAILRNNLMAHLRHTIQFTYSSKQGVAIEQIVISGDCALIPEIDQFIETEMGIKTLIADPILKFNIDRNLNINELRHLSPTLMLSIGLALSNTDGVMHA